MNKKKDFFRLLIKYSVVLLIPIIVIGLVVIFLYFGKLEKKFKELNTSTIETNNICMDVLLEEVTAMHYQVSIDSDVHALLVSKFGNENRRPKVLKSIQEKIKAFLINKNGVENAGIYSKVNDTFINNNSAFNRDEYYERYFSESDYSYEELFDVLDNITATPVWLVTDDYLIYCAEIKVSDRNNQGIFMAFVKKQEILNTLTEVCKNFEPGYAILYRGQEILIQTNGFNEEAYEADYESNGLEVNDMGYRYKDYLVAEYTSQKVGGLTYVYTINFENFGGNIAHMVRSLIIVILVMLGLSVLLAAREIKHINDMYVHVLEENVSLESHLNIQVEHLNRQLILNALRGYEVLSFEKQPINIKNSKMCVLIFKFVEETDFAGGTEERKGVADIVRGCFDAENTECIFLYEREIGYICICGYDEKDILKNAIERLGLIIQKNYGKSIHGGLSTEIYDISNLSGAYERATTALQYCISIHEEGGLIRYSDIMELEKIKIYYPFEKEKQLLRNIRLGMCRETEVCLQHIWQENFEERLLSKGAVRQLLVRMLNTIYDLIDDVYKGEVEKYDEFGRVSRKILQSDNLEASFEMLKSIAISICKKCSARKDGELREKIIYYINKNFADQDMSLDKMASDFEMSYFHLSRLFNEYMQMNFTSYLTGVRLEHSKELLCTTALSVEEIAIQSGFLQSNSFIRAFKKHYGITPGKFRERK